MSENFAAYAGGFEEIHENVTYEEREDEFDIEDEDSIARRKDMEEEIDVDIERIDEVETQDTDLEVENEEVRWILDENHIDMVAWEPRVEMFTYEDE